MLNQQSNSYEHELSRWSLGHILLAGSKVTLKIKRPLDQADSEGPRYLRVDVLRGDPVAGSGKKPGINAGPGGPELRQKGRLSQVLPCRTLDYNVGQNINLPLFNSCSLLIQISYCLVATVETKFLQRWSLFFKGSLFKPARAKNSNLPIFISLRSLN